MFLCRDDLLTKVALRPHLVHLGGEVPHWGGGGLDLARALCPQLRVLQVLWVISEGFF